MQIVRQEFGLSNEGAVKITYRSGEGGNKPEHLLQQFRTNYPTRIAVTVDMIATGTDVKPIECVVFMRMVRSRNFFEQMKGRGVRIIDDNDLRAVTPDATVKDRFVIVDAVGVTDRNLAGVSRLGRSEGARRQGVSTTSVVGALWGRSGDGGFVPGAGVGSNSGEDPVL